MLIFCNAEEYMLICRNAKGVYSRVLHELKFFVHSHPTKFKPTLHEFEKFCPLQPHRPSQPTHAPHFFDLKPEPVQKPLKTHN